MASRVADFGKGARRVAPALLGVGPFGLLAGIAAVEAGLSPLQAMGLSVVVFAGAAQLAVIDLLGANAPLVVVVLTGVIVNLRHLMYSASIAPYFRDLRVRRKAALAYILTDQAYAFSVDEYASDEPAARVPFYLGVGFTLWIVWQVCTVLGIVLGRGIPDAWGLSFAVPLVFIALLVPAITDRPRLAAAVAAALVALAGGAIPLRLGIVVAAVVGVVVGSAVEEALA